MTLKLAKKSLKKRTKRSLDGLNDVLAPGSSVWKQKNDDSIIREPGKPDVRVKDSHLSKFGTKEEFDTDLAEFARRREVVPTGKTTEEKLKKHTRDALKKLQVLTHIRRKKIRDDISGISSIHSNITRALTVRVPTKPPKINVLAPPSQSTN